MIEWININDRLPNPKIEVIVHLEWGKVTTDEYFDRGYAEGFLNNHGCVTHWMPLPQPPKD